MVLNLAALEAARTITTLRGQNYRVGIFQDTRVRTIKIRRWAAVINSLVCEDFPLALPSNLYFINLTNTASKLEFLSVTTQQSKYIQHYY